MASNCNTPKQRVTRSNSNNNVTLAEIKALIENTRNDILENLKSEVNKVTETIRNLTNRVNDLEYKNFSLERKSKESYALLDGKINNIKQSNDERDNELFQKIEQRFFRRNNLIIYGVSEQNEGSVEDRRLKDSKAIDEIFKSIDVKITPQYFQRLGRPNTRQSRPIKITGLHEQQRYDILKKCKSLRLNEKYKGIYSQSSLIKTSNARSKKS